jgi:uncharacterized protein involved in exopolysaccharide biosynthesis
MSESFENLTLGDFLYKQKERFSYLQKKWKLLLLTVVISGGLGLVSKLFVKQKYNAKLSFVLSSDSKGGGISGLASQLGFDFGGSGGNDVFAGDNILTLFKSEKMIKPVLFKKPPHQNDILANIIVKEWKWDKEWASNARTKNSFPFPGDMLKLSAVQDSLLREVHSTIVEKSLAVSRADKKLNVYTVNTTSTSEIFACYLTQFLMDETARFYIDTKTSISKRNLLMLQKEADSLRYLLGRNITSTAASVDRTFNLNTALQVERAATQKSQANSTVVATAYAEVVKNLEIAKITLQKETPLYQIIDVPYLPLKRVVPSSLMFGAVGGLIGLVVTSIILLLTQPKRSSMALKKVTGHLSVNGVYQ